MEIIVTKATLYTIQSISLMVRNLKRTREFSERLSFFDDQTSLSLENLRPNRCQISCKALRLVLTDVFREKLDSLAANFCNSGEQF